MSDAIDVEFIKLEEYCFRKIVSNSNEESNKLKELLDENKADHWFGLTPWLHLYHCALEEDALLAHRDVHKWKNRKGISARDLAVRLKTFAEICANVHNNLSFKRKSNAY